jgi:hypothetical protein
MTLVAWHVAVRKHCANHDVPTPPLGYWAKLRYEAAAYDQHFQL